MEKSSFICINPSSYLQMSALLLDMGNVVWFFADRPCTNSHFSASAVQLWSQ